MWASIASSISSVGSNIRGHFYVTGGSLDREAQERFGDDNDVALKSSLGEFGGQRSNAAAPDRDLAILVLGVLEVRGHLGSGSFSHVWECTVEGRADSVAVKVFKPDCSGHQTRECQLLAELQHPNLVQLYESIDGPPSAIFMELCHGSTLFRLMHDPASQGAFSKISLPSRMRAALDVASCMEYLHANGVLHRDVKASNCLLSSAFQTYTGSIPQVKVADLGLARHEAQEMSMRVGTMLYMAPELMEGEEYSFPIDIYSCGMLIYELGTGRVPFSTSDKRLQNDVAFVLAVSMGERPGLDQLPDGEAGQGVCDLVQACWDAEPANRPTAAELVDRLRSVAAPMTAA